MKTIIVYGSSTGNTQRVAEIIGENIKHEAQVVSVNDVDLNDIKAADLVLFGSSTWDYGNLQEDFETFIDNFSDDLLSGKNVAVFGCGDAIGFADEFCSATDTIRDEAEACGANIVAENLKIDGDPEDSLDDIIQFAQQF